MAAIEHLDIIKTLAKKFARARRIKHIGALEMIAQQLGYPHWNALTADYKKGWRPSPTQITSVRKLVDAVNPFSAKTSCAAAWDVFSQIPRILLKVASPQPKDFADPFSAEEVLGELDGHQFCLSVALDNAVIEGRGWCIVVPEAPSASPKIFVTDRRIKLNPIMNEGFREKALLAAQIRAEQVRARIASDWPRRSTVTDADGNAEHPLSRGVSGKWFCLHCDQSFSGRQMAKNFWHCPSCGATPIDIYKSRWW